MKIMMIIIVEIACTLNLDFQTLGIDILLKTKFTMKRLELNAACYRQQLLTDSLHLVLLRN
jgi:hypothetical protein